MIEILVADDHRLFRRGLINLLGDSDKIRIIGEAENGTEMVQKYFELRPDIILADISMPDISGLEALAQILELDKAAKAIFLTMHEGEEYIYRVYKAGGKGIVSKNQMENELVKIIELVSDGYFFFGAGWTLEKLIRLNENYSNLNTKINILDVERLLSAREIEVFKLIGEGYSSADISEKLLIAKKTVDHHRERIKEKLKATTFHEVFKLAVKYSIFR